MRVLFEMEFPLEAPATRIYEYISNDYGLAKWFANKVEANEEGTVYRCEWDEITVHAKIIKQKKNKYIRFQMQENPENEIFEIRIVQNDVTEDYALIIKDYAEENEVEDYKMLWNSQVKDLAYLLEQE